MFLQCCTHQVFHHCKKWFRIATTDTLKIHFDVHVCIQSVSHSQTASMSQTVTRKVIALKFAFLANQRVAISKHFHNVLSKLAIKRSFYFIILQIEKDELQSHVVVCHSVGSSKNIYFANIAALRDKLNGILRTVNTTFRIDSDELQFLGGSLPLSVRGMIESATKPVKAICVNDPLKVISCLLNLPSKIVEQYWATNADCLEENGVIYHPSPNEFDTHQCKAREHTSYQQINHTEMLQNISKRLTKLNEDTDLLKKKIHCKEGNIGGGEHGEKEEGADEKEEEG